MATAENWGGRRPGAGRPPLSASGDIKRTRSIRMTDADWKRVLDLGGAQWVSDQLAGYGHNTRDRRIAALEEALAAAVTYLQSLPTSVPTRHKAGELETVLGEGLQSPRARTGKAITPAGQVVATVEVLGDQVLLDLEAAPKLQGFTADRYFHTVLRELPANAPASTLESQLARRRRRL